MIYKADAELINVVNGFCDNKSGYENVNLDEEVNKFKIRIILQNNYKVYFSKLNRIIKYFSYYSRFFSIKKKIIERLIKRNVLSKSDKYKFEKYIVLVPKFDSTSILVESLRFRIKVRKNNKTYYFNRLSHNTNVLLTYSKNILKHL